VEASTSNLEVRPRPQLPSSPGGSTANVEAEGEGEVPCEVGVGSPGVEGAELRPAAPEKMPAPQKRQLAEILRRWPECRRFLPAADERAAVAGFGHRRSCCCHRC
jgi:hypothetical protein